MSKRRSSLSHAQSYRELTQFWESQDLADYWEQTQPEQFETAYQVEVAYFALKKSLAIKLSEIAQRREVAEETLLNAWVRDCILEELDEA
jgi:hypothetical protein